MLLISKHSCHKKTVQIEHHEHQSQLKNKIWCIHKMAFERQLSSRKEEWGQYQVFGEDSCPPALLRCMYLKSLKVTLMWTPKEAINQQSLFTN